MKKNYTHLFSIFNNRDKINSNSIENIKIFFNENKENNLKKEMKSVLMANGVRDSEDYQHYNMEEQVLRRIVNNSIQKVLSECIKK